MKRVAIKVTYFFDPIVTRWTTLSDFEHWIAKHLAENNMEAERIEIIGNPELMMVIKEKPQITPPNLPKPKMHTFKQQVKNLEKGTK